MSFDIGRIRHLAEQMHRSEDDAGDPIADGFLLASAGDTGMKWVDPGSISGGPVVPFDHGNMGAGETFDLGDSTWHRGTIDANLTTTIIGFSVDEGDVMMLELTQNGTGGFSITWDADVDFGGADDQPDQAAGSVTFFLVWSSAGNSILYGAKVGSGGGGSALEILDEGVSLDTAVTSINFTGDGVDATNVSHAVTVDIPGVSETNVQAVGHYELMMTGSSPPEPIEDGTGTDWLYVWVYP